MPTVRLTAQKLADAHEAVRKVLECSNELESKEKDTLAKTLQTIDGLYVVLGSS